VKLSAITNQKGWESIFIPPANEILQPARCSRWNLFALKGWEESARAEDIIYSGRGLRAWIFTQIKQNPRDEKKNYTTLLAVGANDPLERRINLPLV